MSAVVAEISELAQFDATTVKNNWGKVARQAREVGQVAITVRNHADYVLLSAERYAEICVILEEKRQNIESKIDQITKEFDQRIEKMSKAHNEASDAIENFVDMDFSEVEMPIVGSTY